MAAKKSGLGRGLDSLFAESAGNTVSAPTSLRLSDIEPDKEQPRKTCERLRWDNLATLIEHAPLNPLRKIGSGKAEVSLDVAGHPVDIAK